LSLSLKNQLNKTLDMKKNVAYFNMSIILYFIFFSLVTTSMGEDEKWERKSCETTSKIKVISKKIGNQRIDETLDRFKKTGFIIDESSAKVVITKPKLDANKKWLRFKFEFIDDTVIIISGEWAKKLRNDLHPPHSSEWKTIVKLSNDEFGSREYEVMTVLADGLEEKAMYYNK